MVNKNIYNKDMFLLLLIRNLMVSLMNSTQTLWVIVLNIFPLKVGICEFKSLSG